MWRHFRAAIVVLILVVGTSQGAEVSWFHSPDKALAAAETSQRPLLLFVGSKHCRYCQKMKRQTFANQQVVKQIQQGFVPLAIDADASPEVVKQLGVQGLPTTIVVSPQGTVLARLKGYAPPKRLRAELTQALRRQRSLAQRPRPKR